MRVLSYLVGVLSIVLGILVGFFLLGVLMMWFGLSSSVFIAPMLLVWSLPVGYIWAPIASFIVLILAIIVKKKWDHSLFVPAALTLLSLATPYFINPSYTLPTKPTDVHYTRVTNTMESSYNPFIRTDQYIRRYLEDGCRISLLAWSDKEMALLYQVADQGYCPIQAGQYTWSMDSRVSVAGNPHNLAEGTVAPLVRDQVENPINTLLKGVLSDNQYVVDGGNGAYIVDSLRLNPERNEYAITFGNVYVEDIIVVQ